MKTLKIVLDGQEFQMNDYNKAWFEQTPVIGFYETHTEEELNDMKIIIDSKTGATNVIFTTKGYRLPCSSYHQHLYELDKNWTEKNIAAYKQVMNISDEDCICKIKQMISANKFDPYFIAQTQYKINNKLSEAFDRFGGIIYDKDAKKEYVKNEKNWNILMRLVDKFRRLHSKFQHECDIYFYLTD